MAKQYDREQEATVKEYVLEMRIKLREMPLDYALAVGEHLKDLIHDDQEEEDTISDVTYELK